MLNILLTVIRVIDMSPYINRSFFPFNRVKYRVMYDVTAIIQIKYGNGYTLHLLRHLEHLLQIDQPQSMGLMHHQGPLRTLQ